MIGDRYYFSDALKKDLNVFSKGTYKVNDKLSTYLDLQGRFINYQTYGLTSSRDPIDVDKSFNFFKSKTGFVYRIKDKNKLYLSYARAQKEQIGMIRKHVSTSEKLDDYELGWRYYSKDFSIYSNLYYMNYSNQSSTET